VGLLEAQLVSVALDRDSHGIENEYNERNELCIFLNTISMLTEEKTQASMHH
jgi:hypothetical protein